MPLLIVVGMDYNNIISVHWFGWFCLGNDVIFGLAGRPGLDDAWEYGRTIPGGSFCATNQFSSQPSLHRSSSQNQIWLSHHYGGREKVKRKGNRIKDLMWIKQYWIREKKVTLKLMPLYLYTVFLKMLYENRPVLFCNTKETFLWILGFRILYTKVVY